MSTELLLELLLRRARDFAASSRERRDVQEDRYGGVMRGKGGEGGVFEIGWLWL